MAQRTLSQPVGNTITTVTVSKVSRNNVFTQLFTLRVMLMICLWSIGNFGERKEMQKLPGNTHQAGLQWETVIRDCSQRERADQRTSGE